jgi:hypothetical protein
VSRSLAGVTFHPPASDLQVWAYTFWKRSRKAFGNEIISMQVASYQYSCLFIAEGAQPKIQFLDAPQSLLITYIAVWHPGLQLF